jgi:hypothetical protein
LLALALNSYKETIDARKRAESLQISIYEECKRNKIKIDSNIYYNSEYIAFLDSVVQLGDTEDVPLYFAFEFDLMDKSVWNMAKNSDAFDLIDKEFIFAASQIYENQQFLYDFSNQVFVEIGSKITEMDKLKTSNLALGIYFYVATINQTSIEIQSDMKTFLEEYAPPEKQ